MVLKPAEFIVETAEGGQGEIIVYVEDPEGHTEEVCHLFKWLDDDDEDALLR